MAHWHGRDAASDDVAGQWMTYAELARLAEAQGQPWRDAGMCPA